MDLKRGPQFAATRSGLAQHGDRARVDAETITYSTAVRAGETAMVATRTNVAIRVGLISMPSNCRFVKGLCRMLRR